MITKAINNAPNLDANPLEGIVCDALCYIRGSFLSQCEEIVFVDCIRKKNGERFTPEELLRAGGGGNLFHLFKPYGVVLIHKQMYVNRLIDILKQTTERTNGNRNLPKS